MQNPIEPLKKPMKSSGTKNQMINTSNNKVGIKRKKSTNKLFHSTLLDELNQG